MDRVSSLLSQLNSVFEERDTQLKKVSSAWCEALRPSVSCGSQLYIRASLFRLLMPGQQRVLLKFVYST